MSERGDFRGIYTVLVDTPEFIDLPPNAQLVWFHLKLKMGAAGIDVIPAVEYVLEESTSIPSEGVRDAIEILSKEGFLVRERNVLWLRNALKFEPSRNLDNENHRKSVEKHLRALPKLAIVNDFAEYYDLPKPFPELIPSEGHRDGIPDHGVRSTENGVRKTDSLSPPARDAEIEKKVRALYGWDGVEGTDPILTKEFEDKADRDRCLDIALARLDSEGAQYQARFFRKILTAVIEEQKHEPAGAGTDPDLWKD